MYVDAENLIKNRLETLKFSYFRRKVKFENAKCMSGSRFNFVILLHVRRRDTKVVKG